MKNAAISSLSSCLKNLATEKICNFILPALTKTFADSSPIFKAGVALALCEMAPLVGKDYTLQKILPIINDLLKDDNSEVRLNSIQNLYKIIDILQMDMLTPAIMTILTSLLKDTQWRVRMATVEFIGHASVKFKKECYQKHFETLFIGYLTNSAAAVRVEGIK